MYHQSESTILFLKQSANARNWRDTRLCEYRKGYRYTVACMVFLCGEIVFSRNCVSTASVIHTLGRLSLVRNLCNRITREWDLQKSFFCSLPLALAETWTTIWFFILSFSTVGAVVSSKECDKRMSITAWVKRSCFPSKT